MGTIFKFKSFEVDQADCAMKINTDGVLLGALVSGQNPNRILDVGTGTGVIALMLAQRFTDSLVEAVEIDEQASARANTNFKNSIFSNRLTLINSSFEDIESVDPYDLIVSNPPFYTNSLHNPDNRKKLARHTDIDFFKRLVEFALQNLSMGGYLSLIVPLDLSNEIIQLTVEKDLYVVESIAIKSFKDTEVIRRIVTFQKAKHISADVLEKEFVIYESKGVYSVAYRQVLQPFFLAF